MRLKGRAPGGIPSLTTQTDDNGTVIGSVKLPVGHIIALPGQPGIPGEDGDDGTDGTDGEVTYAAMSAAIDAASAALIGGADLFTDLGGVQDILVNKVGATNTPNKIYGTTSTGNPGFYETNVNAVAVSLPLRDANGQFMVGTPTDASHVATKAYADTKVSSVTTAGQIYATNSVGNPTTYTRASASTAVNSIPTRDAGGTFWVGEPTHGSHPATKAYADTKALKTITISAGAGLTGGGDLSGNRTISVSFGSTAGTVCEGNDGRLSDARTPTAHGHVISDVTGLQTAIDAKLDKVTTPSRMYLVDSSGNQGVAPYSSGLTPNSVVTRDANNTFQVGTPTAAGHAATKAYVDTAVSGVSSGGSPVTAATAAVDTGESTTSSTYTSLATTTDQVTVTVGASGILQVTINSQLTCSTVHQTAYVSFELSGANTLAAGDARCFWLKNPVSGGSGFRYGMTKVLTGLAPGATTVKMRYRTSANTSTFTLREVSAVAF